MAVGNGVAVADGVGDGVDVTFTTTGVTAEESGTPCPQAIDPRTATSVNTDDNATFAVANENTL